MIQCFTMMFYFMLIKRTVHGAISQGLEFNCYLCYDVLIFCFTMREYVQCWKGHVLFFDL